MLPAVYGTCRDVTFRDDFPVQRNADVRAFDVDFLLVPFSHGPQGIAVMGRDYPVDGSVVLVIQQPGLVNGIVMVQDLDLHAFVGSVSGAGCTNSHPVVGSRRELEFKAENEIIVLLHGIQISESLIGRLNLQYAVTCEIIGLVAGPLMQCGSVKKNLKTFS